MKRVFVFLALLAAVAAAALYFGISTHQSFSKQLPVGCSQDAAVRLMASAVPGKSLWPGDQINDSTRKWNDLRYSIGTTFINATNLRLLQRGVVVPAVVTANGVHADSISLSVDIAAILPLSPVARIRSWLAFRNSTTAASALLQQLQQQLNKPDWIYGIAIKMNRVTDTTMIAVNRLMDHPPSTADVYAIVDEIKGYIKSKGGTAAKAPMLHVYDEGNNNYLVMVAVPTAASVPAEEPFLLKRMLANGYILVSEVTGGPATVAAGEAALKQYVTDHRKTSPAIPFQMLVTDRRTEPDTSKWITQLYFPVMY